MTLENASVRVAQATPFWDTIATGYEVQFWKTLAGCFLLAFLGNCWLEIAHLKRLLHPH